MDLVHTQSSHQKAEFTAEERNDLGKILLSGFVDDFRYLHPNAGHGYTFWQNVRNHRERNHG